MTYEIDTKIDFSRNMGRETNHEVFTMKQLGFTEENLQTYTTERIESDIQESFLEWQSNHLDSGWAVIE